MSTPRFETRANTTQTKKLIADAALLEQRLCCNLEHEAGGSDVLNALSDIGPVA